ncbi:Cytochrome C biogenesis protein transmembrane region [uncultured archaeon]|nr:Cytochrome C biogenesis protein transmembrane region [uncultured archaeon]
MKNNMMKEKFGVEGMTCSGCERIIEKKVSKLPGVTKVSTDFRTGKGSITYDKSAVSREDIMAEMKDCGYVCSFGEGKKTSPYAGISILLGALIVLGGAYVLAAPRIEGLIPSVDQNTSLILLFIVGLFTGFHCVAMCGGFVVSYTTKSAAEGKAGFNLGSHAAYAVGKTLSYTVIGATFGFIGSFFTFTPFLRGAAAILAGAFLVIFGLSMLDAFSQLRRFRLKTPSVMQKLTYKWMGNNSNPLIIGLLNGLMIACGPLQAMYLLAAASGSAYLGGLYLMAFGLGTLPLLVGFGVVTSLVSAQFTHKILKFSGVFVVILGLIMLNRGLTLTGTGYDLSSIVAVASASTAIPEASATSQQPSYQEIRMDVTAEGWSPDSFVLQKGVPVKWVINVKELTNCNKAIQVPKLGLYFNLKQGVQTIEFTPNESGVIPWSCWMGMIPGRFIVKDDAVAAGANPIAAEPFKTQNPPAGQNPANPAPTTTIAAQPTVQVLPADPSSPSNYQEIRMDVTASGFSPNKFVLKRGVPVKWIINGKQLTGCNSAIKVPSLGLQFNVKEGLQTIEFTPNDAGTIQWSCWMGMLRGVFVVQDDTSNVAAALNTVQVPQGGSCGGGGGGCGCGMMR